MVKTNKKIIRSVLMGMYLVIISILLFLTSSLYSFLNTGADRSKMLHTEIKKIEKLGKEKKEQDEFSPTMKN